MDHGIFIFPTDYAIRPDELAREVEQRGFDSLWFPEHTHIPTSRRSPWPGGPNLPQEYWRAHDPFVALMAAGAATTRLKVGTAICLVIERDPIIMAKQAASLDFLTNGRLLFGIGAGWNAEEMEDHGTDFKTRYHLMRERVLAMKEIWTKDEPEFHGKYVNFDPLWSWPKPAQKPHPPVLLGGETKYTLRRVVDYCEGWIPRGRGGPEVVLNGLRDLRDMAEAAGRDPCTISTTVSAARADKADLEAYQAAGVDRVTFALPSAGRDEVLPLLDRYAALAQG